MQYFQKSKLVWRSMINKIVRFLERWDLLLYSVNPYPNPSPGFNKILFIKVGSQPVVFQFDFPKYCIKILFILITEFFGTLLNFPPAMNASCFTSVLVLVNYFDFWNVFFLQYLSLSPPSYYFYISNTIYLQ